MLMEEKDKNARFSLFYFFIHGEIFKYYTCYIPTNFPQRYCMNSIIKLDTRGRLVIPNEFRETLDLKEGDNVLVSLDSKNNVITISPVYGEENNIVKVKIEFGDAPGCLAKIATKLAELKVDLIMTESKSYERGTKARWDIVADISKSGLSAKQLREKLMKTNFVEQASVTQISRDRLHY